jgi:hypothetical protein
MSDATKGWIIIVLRVTVACAIFFGVKHFVGGVIQDLAKRGDGSSTWPELQSQNASEPLSEPEQSNSAEQTQNASEPYSETEPSNSAAGLPQSSSSVESQLPNQTSISESRTDCNNLDAAFDRALADGNAAKARLQDARAVLERERADLHESEMGLQHVRGLFVTEADYQKGSYAQNRYATQLAAVERGRELVNTAEEEVQRLMNEFNWHIANVDRARREVEACESR